MVLKGINRKFEKLRFESTGVYSVFDCYFLSHFNNFYHRYIDALASKEKEISHLKHIIEILQCKETDDVDKTKLVSTS